MRAFGGIGGSPAQILDSQPLCGRPPKVGLGGRVEPVFLGEGGGCGVFFRIVHAQAFGGVVGVVANL